MASVPTNIILLSLVCLLGPFLLSTASPLTSQSTDPINVNQLIPPTLAPSTVAAVSEQQFTKTTVSSTTDDKITDENEARNFIEKVNQKLQTLNTRQVDASWQFNTDISAVNEARLLRETAIFNKAQKEIWREVGNYAFETFQDGQLKRQFQKLSVLGVAALDELESQLFTNISTEMEKIYSSATVCHQSKCELELEPDLSHIMSSSRDFDQLKDVWLKWRASTGPQIRPLYQQYIELGKKAARLNGFQTLDDLWLYPWETTNFKQQVEQLWIEIRPYYRKLHAYVRLRLRQFYGKQMPTDGTIPAHLLGNMWAQSWSNIFDLVAPFPGKKSLDVSETLKSQNFTSLQMFQLSDKFFTDLGLIPMPLSFWQHSMLEKPLDRKVVCHASAWDFYNQKDFRIKMCTNVNMEDLVTVHHEMGHVQYYLQYKEQPVTFREGANPGFHEAVGDLLALSVSTPTHLRKIGLLGNFTDDRELTLNYQMQMALQKIAFLPFSYLMDSWRWDIFSGKVNQTEMNRHWWWYRLQYQGISPPANRTENDFDPGAKYHVPASVEYIRYFVSFVIQFQFHKSLCDIAQPSVPLYECDIDGNQAAGEHLAKVLKLGSAYPWPKAMQLMTGSQRMSAKPLIQYFEPLFEWIDQQLVNKSIGWNVDVDRYMLEI